MTVIVFDRGITASVGPNGCGKSNIVDAIKWVMGEQGARNLRGNAMEDVIFAGTKQKGPLGFCEVKLTFEGTEHLPVSTRYPHGPTLCVERRLERGKGSDYFINRKRCRLSDIQEVLAGTGVGDCSGRRAYAIIEQGQIDQVVSAKADERRYLIERQLESHYRHDAELPNGSWHRLIKICSGLRTLSEKWNANCED